MQFHGFNLHGLSCYYNDGEVVKKNVDFQRWESINSRDEAIRNTYADEGEKWRADPCRSGNVRGCGKAF
jgi:hypothetical protein